jgi:tyrosyl-tRNA synthetase
MDMTEHENIEKIKKIDEFLSRGVENIYPNMEFLREKLIEAGKNGEKPEKLSMYLGIDPTGPTLHLGHAIILKKLADFQALGHEAVLLIGDFTGMIGDPTDKSATRKRLTREEVLANARLYKKQAEVFLNFSGPNPARLVYNSEWLSKMHFGDVLELASKVTVEQMLKRDMFEKRMKESRPIYIHEFLYPLLQGYDSVAMNVDGEIGGNDQTFNMLIGRDLSKSMLNKEKFVVATKLLVDSSGKKMGKTEGNMVSLNQSAEEMFGRVMSWTDGLIIPGFELCTSVAQQDIESMKSSIEHKENNPKDLKMRLAQEIVTIYHGAKAAEEAKQNFINTFKKGALPEGVKEIFVVRSIPLAGLLLKEGLVESKTDFRRLIKGGAINIVSDVSGETSGNAVVSDVNYRIERDIALRIGKKRFIRISVSKK